MKFKLDMQIPSFINISTLRNIKANEYFDIKNFEYIIENYEITVNEYFKDMNLRETIINKLINLNIGFTVEIDSSGFRKFSQYLHINEFSNIKFKSNIDIKLNKKISNSTNTNYFGSPKSKNLPFYFNLFICYVFDREDAKVLSVNIIDCDQLTNIANKKFQFNYDDIDNLINIIFQFIISNINFKLNQ